MVSSKVAELWSAELSLIPTQKLDGTTLRISLTISRTILARFSGVPPYASRRMFVYGTLAVVEGNDGSCTFAFRNSSRKVSIKWKIHKMAQFLRSAHTKQIPMRTMQLNPRKPTIRHEPRGVNKLPNHRIDIRLRHFPGRRKREYGRQLVEVAVAELEPNRAGRNRLLEDTSTASGSRRLAARMAELDHGRCPVFLTRVGIFPPLVHESFVLFLVGVFGGYRDVEGGSEVIHVDLDIP